MGTAMEASITERAQAAALVAATAANLAGWHDLMLRGLGHRTQYEAGLWLTPDRVPVIFFCGIAVRPGASAAACSAGTTTEAWIAVCDPWSDLSLGSAGFSVEGDHSWMVRRSGSVAAGSGTSAGSGADAGSSTSTGRDAATRSDVAPERDSADGSGTAQPGLTIERVTDAAGLADFEVASSIGFGSQVPPPFTWHAPSVLADPRLHVWRGRVDGLTVSTSMSFVEAGVVGVYGVSTVPAARRNGFGRAMTRAALGADPSLPSVLQPSAMAEPLYRQLGYQRFTTFRTWVRPTVLTNQRSTP